MSDTVYLFDTFSATPTYHDYGRIRDHADVTCCGLVLYDGKVRYRAMLREDHAATIGKACQKCFPPVAPEKETRA
jgi:hypothetical protein